MHPTVSIAERFIIGSDGMVEPLASGSKRAVALTVKHAGICKIQRHKFNIV